jgi:hypothetical protein
MSSWVDRVSTNLRDQLSSVMMATALAALIVLGVLAVLIVTVRASQTTYSTAAMTVAVAEVTEDAIATTAALQGERALASTLDHDQLSVYHPLFEGEATVATDRAMQDLRVAWSRNRSEVPDTATPPISDLLAVEVSLGDFRRAALTPSGESTYPLYSEMVALAVAATGELVKQGTDPVTVTDRALIVALLNVAESLNEQRYLIQEALLTGDSLSEELLLQVDVLVDNTSAGLFEARSLASDQDLDAVEEMRTGESAERMRALRDAITLGESTDPAVAAQEWFEASSAQIEQVEALIPVIHARVAAEADDDLQRAGRSLWTRSILLGALFVLSILVASNAVFATRERGEALAEYEELTDGLRQWFVAAAFPDADDVEIAARYIPASIRTRSGGDWYDVYEVGDKLAVVIGDVAGHGAEATAQMAQLRNILRGQSTARTLDPAAQVDLLDHTIADSGILATLTYGLLDVTSGEFLYTRAGHMPLLIRAETGEVRVEEEASGPPVGGGVDLERETTTTRLQPGDVLILITDGLVEAVDRDIDIALDQIAKSLREAGPTPEALLDQLFGIDDEGPMIDDAAALLITWSPRGRRQVM